MVESLELRLRDLKTVDLTENPRKYWRLVVRTFDGIERDYKFVCNVDDDMADLLIRASSEQISYNVWGKHALKDRSPAWKVIWAERDEFDERLKLKQLKEKYGE